MNMHGFITPAIDRDARVRRAPLVRAVHWFRAHRAFTLLVLVPSLLLATYYYVFAADQYESEAHFVIRSSDAPSAGGSGLGAMLGITGAMTSSQSDAMGVSDYLVSHEAINFLKVRFGLVDRFQRPEADFIARLRPANPSPERLESYYRNMVSVEYDRDTGISALRVRSFRGADSYAINRALLVLGEQRVNELNRRGFNDALSSARTQLVEAETSVNDVQRRITAFRQGRRDIDPIGSGEAQIGIVSSMTASLSAARAQLAAMANMISTTSPQYVALQARVRSLERELAGQSGRLAGRGTTIASNLGDYENLKVQQDFAGKRYEAAAANLEKARDQATRQQLYLVRIVEPNMPIKAQYPERGRILLTTILTLLVAYGIGWLLVAGVREHAN